MKKLVIAGILMTMLVVITACGDKEVIAPEGLLENLVIEASEENEQPEEEPKEEPLKENTEATTNEYVELLEIPVIENYDINNLQVGASQEDFLEVAENIVYAYYTNVYDYTEGKDMGILLERVLHLVSGDVFFGGVAEWEAWENNGDEVRLLSLALDRPTEFVEDGKYEEAIVFGVKFKISINGVEESREEKVYLFKEHDNVFCDRIEK